MGSCFCKKQIEFKEHPIIVEELLAYEDRIKKCATCKEYMLYDDFINNYGFCYKCRFDI